MTMLESTTKIVEGIIEMALDLNMWDLPPMAVIITEEREYIIGGDRDPYEMLEMIASSIVTKRMEFAGDITGIVLIHEAWMLSQDKLPEGAGPNALREVAAELALKGLRFSDHTVAVEVKQFLAVDGEGVLSREVTHEDDGSSKLVEKPDPDREVGGALVEALKSFFEAVTP